MMKLVLIVFYLMLLLFASMYLFDRYYMTHVTEEERHSWYDEAAKRYGAEFIASLIEGEE